jgi:hypothetical protein
LLPTNPAAGSNSTKHPHAAPSGASGNDSTKRPAYLDFVRVSGTNATKLSALPRLRSRFGNERGPHASPSHLISQA